jgi:hypothetical protein
MLGDTGGEAAGRQLEIKDEKFGHEYTDLGGTILLFPLNKQHCTFLLFFQAEELPFLKDHR